MVLNEIKLFKDLNNIKTMISLEILLKEVVQVGHQSSLLVRSFLNGTESKLDSSLDTVVGLHGYSARRFTLSGLGHHLEKNRFNVKLINYNFWYPIDKTTPKLIDQIDDITQKTGKRVKLLGHSQGGVLSIDIGQQRPDLVQTVIALGPPLKGTHTAYLNYPIPSCRQMTPNNSYCKELLDRDFPKEVDFYSIYSPFDQVIRPWHSALLPEGYTHLKNIYVDNVGHLGLIGPKCYDLVERLLRERVYSKPTL